MARKGPECAGKRQRGARPRSASAQKRTRQDPENLEPAWGAAVDTSASLKAQLRALESKLDEAKRKKSTLIARQRAAEARQHMEHTNTTFEAGLQAHSNFTRMEERVAEIEARTEAITEVNGASTALENDFQDMEVDIEVEAELTALKQKLNKTAT